MDQEFKMRSLSFWDIFMHDAASAMQLLTPFTGDHRLLSELLPVSLASCFAMQILQTSSDFPGEMHGMMTWTLRFIVLMCATAKCSAAAGILETTHKHHLGLQTETNFW